MEKQPITNLDLRIFDPEHGTEKIKEYAVDAGLVPLESISTRAMIQASQTKNPEYFMGKTGKKVQERASKSVYEAIEKKYDLMEGAGKGFWKKQWGVARNQVQTLVQTFTPDDKSIFGFLDEVESTPTPSEVIRYLASEKTDPRLKFEITRQTGLSIVAAELETKSQSAEERLKEVQEWLNIDIFDDQTHPSKIQEVWALHDNATNETIHIDMAEDNHDDIEGAHWKKHKQRMRYAGDEIGWVMKNGRIKQEGVNKTIKKAILRGQNGEDDKLDPHNDVPDIMGMQFIVKDELYHDGEKVQNLIKKVQEVLANRFEGIRFEEKNGTTGDKTKSGKFQAYRLMANFPDMKTPLELMFHGQEDHFRNTHHIGETDEQTKRPNGAAHKIMEADRALQLMEEAYFPTYPKDVPDDEKFYGNPDWKTTRKEVFKAIEKRLRNANLPPEEKTENLFKDTGETIIYQDKDLSR